jgi:hypothetical protein
MDNCVVFGMFLFSEGVHDLVVDGVLLRSRLRMTVAFPLTEAPLVERRVSNLASWRISDVPVKRESYEGSEHDKQSDRPSSQCRVESTC